MGHILWQMFGWPSGNVLGNILAAVMCAVAGWLAAARHYHCSKPRCFRPGRHPVGGTTFRTCRKHTTQPAHDALKARHADKFPDQHKYLAGAPS